MNIIYIDREFKCHASDGEGLTAVETDFFDGKCAAYIEGYRYVPSGAIWIRKDGMEFVGEMVAPWKPWEDLDKAQREYEREQHGILTEENAEYEAALSEIEAALGVGV